jgi:hypothetical protein
VTIVVCKSYLDIHCSNKHCNMSFSKTGLLWYWMHLHSQSRSVLWWKDMETTPPRSHDQYAAPRDEYYFRQSHLRELVVLYSSRTLAQATLVWKFQCHQWGWNPSLLQPAWTELGSRLISHCQSVLQHPPSLHPELVRWYLSGLVVHLVDSKTAQRDRIILAVSCVHGDASQLLTSKMHLNQI